MKIHILPISKHAQPDSQAIVYPAHNHDYGVEQDFYNFLIKHQNLLTSDSSAADWHYLPIYWTRWHLNHNYAKDGLDELQKIVDDVILDSKKTFTVCQYDDGPVVNIYKSRMMLASRKGKIGIDIPLLSKPLKKPIFIPSKEYLASFVGRLSTHPIRESMYESIVDDPHVKVVNGNLGTSEYVHMMLKSYIALCPRGYGGSSFRFYEAMQLGITPFLIGDNDVRPFKSAINWDEISIYAKEPKDVPIILSKYSHQELKQMGQFAKKIWKNQLKYQKWCNLALKELQ